MLGALGMQAETATVHCPACGQAAQLALFQHTDEQGHPLRHELEFVCSCHHRPTEVQLMTMWADAHTVTPT